MNGLLVESREKKKITRKKLAEVLSISISMVEKVENGSRRASPDLARRWGNALGIKETQLYKYFFTEKQDNMSSDNPDLPRTG